MMTHAKAKSEMRVECPAVVVVSDTTNFERNGLGRKLLERGVLIEKVVEPKTIGDVRATSLYCKSEPHVVIAVEGRYGSGVLKETEAIAASRGEFILLKYQTSDASWRKLDAVVAKRGREHAPAAANAQITQVVAADTREVSPQREPLNHLHQLKEALANASALQTQLEVERQQGGVIARERLSRDLTMKEAQRLEVIALNDRLRESLEAEQTLRRRDQEEAAKLRAELEEERMDHERTKRRPPPVQVVSKTNETDEGLARMLKKVRAVVVAVEEDVLSDKDGIAKIAEAVR